MIIGRGFGRAVIRDHAQDMMITFCPAGSLASRFAFYPNKGGKRQRSAMIAVPWIQPNSTFEMGLLFPDRILVYYRHWEECLCGE